MPGGEMNMLVEGNQNVILNGNPTKTFFTSVYKKYTNFAIQKFRLDYNGLRELKTTQESFFTFTIKRYADLLADIYVCVTLPNIYSPVYPFSCNGENGVWVPYEFQWIKNIGFMMIKEVELYCGGTTIQKFSGDYLNAMRYRDMGNYDVILNEMIGNIPEINDPANSGLRKNAYPSATYNAGITQEPSIRSKKIYIPLNLWFCLNKQQAIPLCALQYNEIEVKITLRPIRELYTIRDVLDSENSYPRIAPKLNTPEHAFYRFLQEPIDPDINIYANTTTSWNQDIHLLANYVFLTDIEKTIFTGYPQTYLIKEIHEYSFTNITATSKQKVETTGLVSDWTLLFKRSDISLRNEWSNYTNWTYDYLPSDVELANDTNIVCNGLYGYHINQDDSRTGIYSSGNYAFENEKNILVSLGILFDGEYREHVFHEGVFRLTEPYIKCPPSNLSCVNDIYCYNFCLDTSPFSLQPNGGVNLTKYYDIELELTTLTPPVDSDATFDTICDPNTNEIIGVKKPSWKLYDYTYSLLLLENRYNILEIANGNLTLMYAR